MLETRAGMRLVRVRDFEPAVYVAAADRDAYDRRFMMLTVDEGTRRNGGICQVARATGPAGERFALKALVEPAGGDASAAEARRAAFDEEYRIHKELSGLRGFPRLFGRGEVDGAPVIIMEWVEGVTLEHAARRLAVDDDGRISPLWAARLGRDLFELLDRMAYVDSVVVHRDISPRNVMVCTARTSLQEQTDEGVYELRVIDFGSAGLMGDSRRPDGRTLRPGATPDYAPPELLGCSEGSAEECAPAMDVYAAASVVYRLVEGCPPYGSDLLSDRSGSQEALKREKTAHRPRPITGAHGGASDVGVVLEREPEVAVAVGRAAARLDQQPTPNQVRAALMAADGLLDDVLQACLQVDAVKRPTAAQVKEALAVFAQQYADNIERGLKGEPLEPCMGRQRFPRTGLLRSLAREGFRILCVALCVAASVVVGLLVNGMDAAFPAWDPVWAGPVPGALVAGAVLLPLALGLVGRWRRFDGRGAVRATAGCAVGFLAVAAGAACTAWPVHAVGLALTSAAGLCAASAFSLILFDCLFSRRASALPSESDAPLLPDKSVEPELAAGEESCDAAVLEVVAVESVSDACAGDYAQSDTEEK